MTAAGAGAIDWIGIDWAGTNWETGHPCAFAVTGDGTLIDTAAAQDAAAGNDTLARLIGGWLPARGSIPVITCGAPGLSGRPVPCTPIDTDLLHRPNTGDARIALLAVPGLRQDRPVDATQGAETRIAGYLAGHPDFDGVLCLPGSRGIWARISAGEVVSIASFLTGEMFTLLAQHSRLRDTMSDDTGIDVQALDVALDETLSRPERLAGALARIGLQPEPAARVRACLAGALIGAELAAARPWWLGQAVVVIGGPETAPLYVAALARQGITAPVADGRKMALAGLARARAALRALPHG